MTSHVSGEQSSYKHLKLNLREVIRNSGALGNVKAQLRKEFIAGLNGGRTTTKHVRFTVEERIIFSLLFNFLRSRKLDHTLSVFVADLGCDEALLFTDDELKPLVGIDNPESDAIGGLEVNQSLFEDIFRKFRDKLTSTVQETSVQTDMGNADATIADFSQYIRNNRKSKSSKIDTIGSDFNTTVEEKMISFQRDCEARMRAEYDLKLKYFLRDEIDKVRNEESRKLSVELENWRKILESDYQNRLRIYSERESLNLKAAEEKERIMQQAHFEAREKLQREIDNIRERERASSRKIELESQGLHMLELRMKEMQAILESREREVSDKERQIGSKTRDCVERARNEAKLHVQMELDSILKERMQLVLDRQRLDDDRLAQAAWVQGVQNTHQLLREAQCGNLEKDEEIKSLQFQLRRFADRPTASELPTRGQDCSISGPNHDLDEMQKSVASLQVQLGAKQQLVDQLHTDNQKMLKKCNDCESNLCQSQEELCQCKTTVRELENQLISCQRNADVLLQELQKEQSRSIAARHKIEELEKVVRDQTKAMQLLTSQRSDIVTSVSGAAYESLSCAEYAADNFEKKYHALTKDISHYSRIHGNVTDTWSHSRPAVGAGGSIPSHVAADSFSAGAHARSYYQPTSASQQIDGKFSHLIHSREDINWSDRSHVIQSQTILSGKSDNWQIPEQEWKSPDRESFPSQEANQRQLELQSQQQQLRAAELRQAEEAETERLQQLKKQQRGRELRELQETNQRQLELQLQQQQLRAAELRQAEEAETERLQQLKKQQRERELRELQETNQRQLELQSQQQQLRAAELRQAEEAETERLQQLKKQQRERELRELQETNQRQLELQSQQQHHELPYSEDKKKEEDDKLAIAEARAKVLARRKQKQMRDESTSNTWTGLASTVTEVVEARSVAKEDPSPAPLKPNNSPSDDASFEAAPNYDDSKDENWF